MSVMCDENRSELANATLGDPIISDDEKLYQVVSYYLMDIGTPTVCGFGLVGNTLNLLVLTREKKHRNLTKMEKSAHMGLIALAFSDFMFCLFALLFTILPLTSRYEEKSFILYYEFLGGSFISIFIITSTWLIVCMAGERYFAVCHPFKARKIISLKKTRISIILIFVCCTLFSIPLFLENVIATEVTCSDNTTWYVLKTRDGYTENMHVIRRLVWSILADFVPCISLVFFNACLIWKIQKAKNLRKKMSGFDVEKKRMLSCNSNNKLNSKNSNNRTVSTACQCRDGNANGTYHNEKYLNWNQPYSSSRTTPHTLTVRTHTQGYRRRDDSALNSVTATLVAVVVLFLILVSPSEILKFATYHAEHSSEKNFTHMMIKKITNFMQAVNFSVNFILYCAVNKSFRETLANILCFCRMSVQIRIVRKTPRDRYTLPRSPRTSSLV